MLLKPSFQYQEDQDESMVTRAELLLRDTVQYREKLAAIKVNFMFAKIIVLSDITVSQNLNLYDLLWSSKCSSYKNMKLYDFVGKHKVEF